MYYVLSGFALSTSFPIFGRHNENGKARAPKHLGETFDGGNTGAWRHIELIYVEAMRFGQVVSDFLPILASAVSDKDGGWNSAWFANGEVTNVGEQVSDESRALSDTPHSQSRASQSAHK